MFIRRLKQISDYNPNSRKELLPIGTKVRFKLGKKDRTQFQEPWTDKVYTVAKVITPRDGQTFWSPYYYLNDIERNVGIKKRFYKQDLQVVKDTTTSVAQVKRFAISAILNPRVDEDGEVWYLVAWKNY